ncbi:hypothetical protein GRF29_1g355355 [Pseudopithomyces chartarum]|uniref:Flavin-containing monooxygenase n=1 Tax=Pseudopithomyces chartarum TaxID=1892770 RepID=A0AAN6M5B5_9PLEO|nr:hypothetical protein GRF29_1g355355 [Pseudopithomyces chartarum]
MSKKSVAIIGAGPAGLIAARKLLTLTPFDFTIFEKSARVGGLWDRESFIHPEMTTNFCRFTGSFSDFSWESLKLGRPAPIYPQAWMVERYLQEYAELVPAEHYRFCTAVTKVEKENGKWKIGSHTKDKKRVDYFDHVIIATGYLSTPKDLRCEMDATLKTNPLFPVPILHSTRYRDLEQIIPFEDRSDHQQRTVLVIGGSHSGTDISGLIAHQASDARWRPEGNKAFGGVQVVHVGLNAMLPVPGIVCDATAEHVSMHPLEFTLCERSTREPAPLEFRFGPASAYENQVLLSFYKEVIEGGVADVDFEERLPPNVAYGDRYYPYVQDGKIKPIRGVVRRLEKGTTPNTITAIIKGAKGEDVLVVDVAAVINATGFHSSDGLDFLADGVKRQLEFDATNARLPAVLNASYMSQNANIPDIALLGFVPVNWGVIEMQMRAVANRWLGRPIAEDPQHIAALGDHMRYLQGAVRDGARKEEVPQFLFGDYIGLMEQAAKDLGLSKINGKHGDFDGFVCSSRYVGTEESRGEALKTLYAVHHLREDIDRNNPLLAWVAFSGLTGRWRSEFTNFDGTKTVHDIDAHPRRPTAGDYDLEYVIVIRKRVSIEDDKKHTFIARYTELTHEITLWEVNQAVYLKTGGLISKTRIDRDASGELSIASGTASSSATFAYQIDFRGSRLDSFTIVRGTGGGSSETLTFRRPKEIIGDSLGAAC